MRNIIRFTRLLSFIFIGLALSACGAYRAEKSGAEEANKPLILPKIESGKPRIVAFGDSLTAGFGLAEPESYPFLLQQKLNADGFDYEVVNAGVSGETSLGGLERIDWVLEQDNVKIIILELGANDLLRGIPVAEMKKNLDEMIRKAKAKNVPVLLCGMLAPPTMGSDYERDYRNAFPDLADQYKINFVPFLLDGVALKPELNQADGIHPNAEGTKIMTQNVYRELKPMLVK
ncbi:MAG TPA: arylesterase [Blastocatellia bacterium]|nr:arylesterase [Blastocatellia bacterium]